MRNQVVRTYKSNGAMQLGIGRLARRGYRVANINTYLGNRGAGKFLIGFLAKQKTFYTVLYEKMERGQAQTQSYDEYAPTSSRARPPRGKGMPRGGGYSTGE